MNTHNQIRFSKLISSLQIKTPFAVEKLSGGLSGSEIFKVKTQDRDYVFRFWNMHKWAEEFPQDLSCQLVASDVGYGPKVYFSDLNEGITVMEYHSPETLPEIQTRLKKLADLLKKIHTGPQVPEGTDRALYFDWLIGEIKESYGFDLKLIKTIKDIIFTYTRSKALKVPCHRDLHHGNILFTQGRYLAIDYTWGSMDDPFSDLATIAIFNCNTMDEENLLLEFYLERAPNIKEKARFSLIKLISKIFYGLEFLGIAGSNNINLSMIQAGLPKAYKDFGSLAYTHPSLFLSYAISLLNEVIHYTQTEQYTRDLAEVVS